MRSLALGRAGKSAEQAGNEQKRLLETEQQLRLEISAELAAEQAGRLQAEAHARKVRAQLKETEELRRAERLGGKEAAAALELQLSGLTVSKAKPKLERDTLFKTFCPGAENRQSTQQQQQQETRPILSAAEQIIRGKIEVKRADFTLLGRLLFLRGVSHSGSSTERECTHVFCF